MWAWVFRNLIIPEPYVACFSHYGPFDVGRDRVTRDVLKQKVDYVFYLDTDVLVDPDTLLRLLDQSKRFDVSIVSGLYYDRHQIPPKPVASDVSDITIDRKTAHCSTPEFSDLIGLDVLVSVDLVGCGCLLVRSDVFKGLEKSKPNFPFFVWGRDRVNEDGSSILPFNEDGYFCNRCLSELGVRPHVSMSVLCDHEMRVIRKGEGGVLHSPLY